jgi:hypothetical protein
MGAREMIGEIDGLVLAFIGLTIIMALSFLLIRMTLEWRIALGIPIVTVLVLIVIRKNRASSH